MFEYSIFRWGRQRFNNLGFGQPFQYMKQCTYVLLVIITFSGMIAMDVLYGCQYSPDYR